MTGIDEGDAPFLLRSGQDCPLTGLEIDGEVGDMTEIIVKILFDDITLVTAADDEFVDAVTGSDFMMCHRIGFPPISAMGLGIMRFPAQPRRDLRREEQLSFFDLF